MLCKFINLFQIQNSGNLHEFMTYDYRYGCINNLTGNESDL